MKLTTKSGFTCNIDTDALNDWEIHEILMKEDDPYMESRFVQAVMQKCLSKKDADALKDHVRTETGRIPADALKAEVFDLIQTIGKEKNS